MEQETSSITFTWDSFEITATMTTGWPFEDSAHIEVRCEHPLPITSTGYRSIYSTFESVTEAGGLEAYLRGGLDEKAKSKEWKKHVEDTQQLSLF